VAARSGSELAIRLVRGTAPASFEDMLCRTDSVRADLVLGLCDGGVDAVDGRRHARVSTDAADRGAGARSSPARQA